MPTAPQSHYQGVFRVSKPDSVANDGNPRFTSRNRQSLSCVACRTRKSKCDRVIPCSSCSRRGQAASCSLSSTVDPAHDMVERRVRPSDAQVRLQKLENMITSLMNGNSKMSRSEYDEASSGGATGIASPVGTPSIVPSQASDGASKSHAATSGSETDDTKGTNWTTILENIKELQDTLGDAEEPSRNPAVTTLPGRRNLGLSRHETLSIDEIYESLPPRNIVDSLLSIFFQAEYFRMPIIHVKKFQREYDQFWVNPSSISLIWTSMLFSILCLACQVAHRSGQNIPEMELEPGPSVDLFLIMAGRALIAGQYFKARTYSVEALLFFGLCKIWDTKDMDQDSWMIMGIGVRIAMKMGYHRNPESLANVSVFEGEMRRRAFHILESFDVLLSFQAGLPAVIHEEDCDTEAPRNLFDDDFDEDCTTLPPSRPPTDPTPMLYYCTKNKIISVFRKVVHHTFNVRSPTFEETMKLDKELRDLHDKIPLSLRPKCLANGYIDRTHTILHRLNLEILYLKSLIVLHRTKITSKRLNSESNYSRKTCSDSALQILDLQAELHRATQKNGMLRKDYWMISSIASHDFLLAAIVICLELSQSSGVEGQVRKQEALTFSYNIWMSKKSTSRKNSRVSSIFGDTTSRELQPDAQNFEEHAFELPSTSRPTFTVPELDLDFLHLHASNSLNQVLNDADNIDWGLVDQYIFDQNSSSNDFYDSSFL